MNPEALCDGIIDCIDKSDETIAAKCGKFTTMRWDSENRYVLVITWHWIEDEDIFEE